MITMLVMIFEVAVSTVIRVVIVFNAAAVPLPATRIIPFTVVVWCYPMSSLVRGSSPIAFMPFIMFSRWVPITLYPYESRIWP